MFGGMGGLLGMLTQDRFGLERVGSGEISSGWHGCKGSI